ncbi:MAG TPA: hypothetical protein VK919_11080, partial [Solirubrobacterales bacterium]|nr:hypothetical protein [Solirubrobacterales bacterium]
GGSRGLLRARPRPSARRAIDVIVVSSIAVNLAAITGGVLVFGDPLGSSPLAIVARSAAFAAVIVAAALIPAVPRREPRAVTA